jgi:hypothetical protein
MMPLLPGSRRRRPRNRGMRGPARPALRKLRRAHRLLAAGNPEAAALIFERLGRAAQSRGLVRAAPLRLEAGMAFLQAGDRNRARELIEDGLGLVADNRGGPRAASAARRALQALEAHGMGEDAVRLRAELFGDASPLPSPGSGDRPGRTKSDLPPTCPHCGGPVRPEELEDPGGGLVYCMYCGLSLGGGA